jgi:hypothetical protein
VLARVMFSLCSSKSEGTTFLKLSKTEVRSALVSETLGYLFLNCFICSRPRLTWLSCWWMGISTHNTFNPVWAQSWSYCWIYSTRNSDNKPIYFCVFSIGFQPTIWLFTLSTWSVFFNHNRLCFQKQECIFAKSNREKYYSGWFCLQN